MIPREIHFIFLPNKNLNSPFINIDKLKWGIHALLWQLRIPIVAPVIIKVGKYRYLAYRYRYGTGTGTRCDTLDPCLPTLLLNPEFFLTGGTVYVCEIFTTQNTAAPCHIPVFQW